MWGDAPGYFVINVQMQHKSGHCMEGQARRVPFLFRIWYYTRDTARMPLPGK
jgi:hypothetical protein